MDKYYVLQDVVTGRYFTNDYEKYWHDGISNAWFYNGDEDIDRIIQSISRYYGNCVEGVEFIEAKIIYR